MLKGKTTSGFEFEISDERAQNYELMEVMAEVDENPIVMPKVINLLLGKDGANRLKDHLRDEDGFVPIAKMGDEIKEIFQSSNEIKNS